MVVGILGAGQIGSTLAFYLARAGHEVTVIARGARLAELQRDGGIVTVSGERAPIRVAEALDPTTPWDVVLVPVRAHQVDSVLPALQASAAKTVLFMFNTMEPLERLRLAVGPSRFAFAFPMMTAAIVDGRLDCQVNLPGQPTTVSDARWAQFFEDAGLHAEVAPDMEAWLRSHAAFMAPVMAVAGVAYTRRAGVTWAEARAHAAAMGEAFAVVRHLGHRVTPAPIAVLGRLPTFLTTALLWLATRAAPIRQMGSAGPGEVRALVDGFSTLAPGRTPALLAIRP
jgi:2-dehydropantoate 2-reductase